MRSRRWPHSVLQSVHGPCTQNHCDYSGRVRNGVRTLGIVLVMASKLLGSD